MNFTVGRRLKDFVKVKFYVFFNNLKLKLGYKAASENKDIPEEPEGFKRWYYDNGNIKAEFYHKGGKVEGIANMYYESGAIKAREFYKEDKLQGLSKWYYESGELKSEKYYKEGVLYSTKEFNKDGIVINEQIFQK
jgi:antitoxin component YwqK of YwqJK toxin-antitoxin module